jgi:hypothetical protein
MNDFGYITDRIYKWRIGLLSRREKTLDKFRYSNPVQILGKSLHSLNLNFLFCQRDACLVP